VPPRPRRSWLVAHRGRAVHLGAGLAIHHQPIEAKAGKQGRLAIFSRHLEVAGTEPPGAVGPFPAEQRADDEDLPRLEREWLPRPFAFAVVQTGKEPNRALDCGEIERESGRMPARLLCQLPIATVARARLPHQPARRHLACEHRIGIREDVVTLRHLCGVVEQLRERIALHRLRQPQLGPIGDVQAQLRSDARDG
jgi:hypothetical protein